MFNLLEGDAGLADQGLEPGLGSHSDQHRSASPGLERRLARIVPVLVPPANRTIWSATCHPLW